FALGDAETGIWRTKVFLLFARYFLAGYVVFLGFAFQSNVPFVVLFFALFAYLFWSVRKHARYVTAKRSLTILPRLQFTADIAVLAGTVIGIVKFLFRFIKEQKIVSGCIALYIGFVVSVLSWGVPNNLHPFTYHMDEWHQLMALKAMVKHGTTTIAGSAEIPFVYPLLSGLYLIPFVLFHFIDPFSLKSPVENVVMQGRLFEILRSVNILFGVGSMILVAKIARDYLKSNGALAVVFFSVTPIFLLLSTYFKYDICLLFWIILSIFLMLRFGKYPTLKNYLLAAGASGIAMGTKFSAIPLLPLLLFAYFWFLPKKRNAFKDISLGLMVYGVIFLLVGVPSVFIGTANYGPLLYSNLIDSPSTTNNLILQSHWFTYLVGNQYPLLFGHSALLLTACASFVILYFVILKKRFGGNENKAIIFLFVCFILFFISLLPLKIWATRNRALVLLPFLALLSSWFIAYIYTKGQKIYKYGFLLVIVGLLVVQIYETGAWLYAKYRVDIQKESSLWIEKHIAKGTTIGVEEIVLYQGLPNIIEKEFYLEQYKKPHNNKYRYEIMTSDMHTLPAVVVITDADVSRQLYRQASKNDVLKRLERDGYKKKKEFVPDVSYLLRFTDTISYYLAGNAANPTSITIYTKE
ncbi:MAG TPA: glycosyltransferase family 39 protein, partial [Patescibacteria group bacterium]|nr:glycosyltransferase family 39 protein [Patescibacteria group bacterium]